jgi:hypothetical protein
LDGCLGKTSRRESLWDGFNIFVGLALIYITLGTLYQKPYAVLPSWISDQVL